MDDYEDDVDEEVNYRHYAEIYRKLNDDGFLDLAHRVKMMIGLTEEEMNGAVGPRYWGAADDEQRTRDIASLLHPPPSAALLPPQSNRMQYAEICRKLVEDGFPVEAGKLKRIFRLTNQEILEATVGPHYWAEADKILTWADSLFRTPPPSPPR